MNSTALAIYIFLGLIEFFVINRALRSWLDRGGLVTLILASVASYVPIVGGAVALVGAITVLEWPWWLSGILFIGGSAVLAITGGFGALLGTVSFF